jgi:L-sorbose 1-phosphate reductase
VADKLNEYRRAVAPLPDHDRLWPLYGAGFEHLGRDGRPIDVPMPLYGPDELLVRHDACGLCFSDIKVISQGEQHPRIFKDMRRDPVVLGHEVAMTVVGVGERLRDQYRVGDRFIVQADIFSDGVGYAYGYMIQGGLSRYGVIDQRILNGDGGNYLLPVKPSTGYAESALVEPWACVIAAYQLQYRSALKPSGTTWIIGAAGARSDYTIGAGFDASSHPARLLLTNVPDSFAGWLKACAGPLGLDVIEVVDIAAPPVTPIDDIVLLGADPDVIEAVSPHLADHGILAIVADDPLPRRIAVDIGRVHYNRWFYVGGRGADIARAYSDVPARAQLKPGGLAWFVGAGGPIGHMHVQRAIQLADGPATIVCTDVSDMRLRDLWATFGAEARANGIDMICLNPSAAEAYADGMAAFEAQGFDDVIVLAPIPAVIATAARYLAPAGVMNIFAGVGRGTLADLDLTQVYRNNIRVIGHSASTIDDLREMLRQTEAGELSTARSVAAIGSLSAARDGLRALQEAAYPGKVVIFPQLHDLPLTMLADLKDILPGVYAKLKNGRGWTNEAEAELFRELL